MGTVPARKRFRYILPSIPQSLMHLKKTVLFKRGPGQFGNGRVKVIVPSLATLLACTLAEGIVLLQ